MDKVMQQVREKIELEQIVGTAEKMVNNAKDRIDKIEASLPGMSAEDFKHVVSRTSTNTAGRAIKFDQDKLPLHLLSTEAMNQTAAVLKFGAQKYAEHNWRKGFTWSRPLSAAMRHLTAFNAGEDKDPESGLSHLAHAACCIMFLLEFEKTHPELDDRYRSDV